MDKLFVGIFYAILAGIIASTQNVFSARLGEKLGMWEATLAVHLVGLVFSIFVVLAFGKGDIKAIASVNKIYLLAGVLGVFIVYTIGTSISIAGATMGTIAMVITQLVFSTVIDTYGLFGVEKIPFDFTKIVGLVIMIFGVVVFKIRG